MTGRIPVIHWGAGCRYTDAPDSDAFSTFFKPLNEWGLSDMQPLGPDYYPEKWRGTDLCADRFEQWSGLGGRRSGFYLLNRPEPVIVSDFYTQIFEVTPWLAPDHWLHGCNAHEVFARLYRKYFKLRPDIQADIDAFANAHIKGRPTLGVHVRNADKASESASFQDNSDQIAALVERYMQQDESLRLFLLTDSAQAVETYRARYGDRVFFTDSARADGDVGVHVAGQGSRHQLGVEVIKDTYLAAACDRFIGLGASNLPCMVSVLKGWPAGAIHLIGENRFLQENTLLHDW
jgi:protein O-GlcNAc transferase